MKLTAFTHLAFLINEIIDAGPDTDFSLTEILDAACDRQLIKLVIGRYGHLTDFYFLLSTPARLKQMEAALCDAAAGFRRDGDKPTSPVSGLCLVMDIVLEAIQRQCSPSNSRINIETSGGILRRYRLNGLRSVLRFFESVFAKTVKGVIQH